LNDPRASAANERESEAEERTRTASDIVRRAHDAWGEWIGDLGTYTHFVTRTFRDDVTMGFTKVGLATARKCVVDLLKIADPERMVCVVEWQKERRVPHLHAVLATPHDLDGRWMQDRDEERYGFSRWMLYRVPEDDGGADKYLGKYLVKEVRGPYAELYVYRMRHTAFYNAATDKAILELGRV